MKIILGLLFLACLPPAGAALAEENAARALYLANEGVMVSRGEVKVLFDPLFAKDYGQYQLLPAKTQRDLLAGRGPFDSIDAVFVSHYHGDHFDPVLMLAFLKARSHVRLYAPMQAVKALRKVAVAADDSVFERVTGLSLKYQDDPIKLQIGHLLIEAVHIPHSGWPVRMLEVENISFRVTLDDTVSVLHLGDADPDPVHFENDAAYWRSRITHVALPPYWFFPSTGGRKVLDNYLKPELAIGIHVPTAISDRPADRPAEFGGYELFTEPGEYREIPP